jgi:hypothetical protein
MCWTKACICVQLESMVGTMPPVTQDGLDMNRFRIALAVIVASLAWASPASATTWYVGPPCANDPYPNAFCDREDTVKASDAPRYAGQAVIEAPGTHFGGPVYNETTLFAPAWRRWRSGRWTEGTIAGGTEVWLWPWRYDSGWSWVWTDDTGWRAVQSEYVVIHYGLKSCARLCM